MKSTEKELARKLLMLLIVLIPSDTQNIKTEEIYLEIIGRIAIVKTQNRSIQSENLTTKQSWMKES